MLIKFVYCLWCLSNLLSKFLIQYTPLTWNTGEDLNEWIAMNLIEMYNTINLCYNIVSEFCTESACPQVILKKRREKERGGEGGGLRKIKK